MPRRRVVEPYMSTTRNYTERMDGLDPDFEETQQDQADDSVHILDEDTGWMA